MAKRIGLVAVNDGWNVILDVTLASRPSAESWTYALRFADFTVTAVYAGLTAEESVRRSAEAYQHGEEEYEHGRGYGGRYLPPDAIRALSGPAASAARDSIRWVSGAESASAVRKHLVNALLHRAGRSMIHSAEARAQLAHPALKVCDLPEVRSAMVSTNWPPVKLTEASIRSPGVTWKTPTEPAGYISYQAV